MNFTGIKNIDSLLKKYSAIRGEYWIDDSGIAIYADGDVGDMNHEMYVLQQLIANILMYFDIEIDEFKEWDLSEYYDELYEAIDDEYKNSFKASPDETIKHILEEKGMKDVKGVFQAFHDDPREYALKNWGWKRVQGNNIQTMYLTSKDLKIINRGLWDIVGEEEDETFDIEVYETHDVYEDVPVEVIESENPSKFLPYKRLF